MKKTILRALSIFLLAFLLIGTIPIAVSAAEATSEFEYSILDDGTVEVTKYVDNGESNVIIPEEIEGKIVTRISDKCFVKATYPEVAGIAGFESIESIFIPKTVTYFTPNPLVAEINLKEIIVDSENTKYASIDGVLFDKDIKTLLYYPRSKPADEYTTPNTVKIIKSFAFFQNMTLKKLKFGAILDEVTLNGILALEELEYPIIKNQINEGVVGHCMNLVKVIIGKEVTFIPDNEFSEWVDNPVLYVYDNTYGLEWARDHGFDYKIIKGPQPSVERELVDSQTGVQVSGFMDADAVLKVKAADNTLENAVSTFNITLEKDGSLIQPDGKITVSIPSEYGDCNVFWIKEDGTKVNMNAEYANGSYVFTTDHLSIYALVKNTQEPTQQPDNATEPTTNTAEIPTTAPTTVKQQTGATSHVATPDSVVSNTPKSGGTASAGGGFVQTGDIPLIVILTLAVIGVGTGITLFIRKKNLGL